MLTAMLGVEIIVRKRRTILDKRKQPRTWGEKEKTLGRVFLLLLTAAAVLLWHVNAWSLSLAHRMPRVIVAAFGQVLRETLAESPLTYHQIGLFQAICPRGSWWEEAFALHLEKGWLVLRWASTG